MHSGPAFLRFWWNDQTRDAFLSYVPKDELASLRLACHDFSVRAAPALFEEINVTFRASIFTKPARMAALNRIGEHVRVLRFNAPHSAETFLTPLLDRATGEEIPFIYEPYIPPTVDSTVRPKGPNYGSWEMTDTLIKQYSPLFHAAANVSSFIRAFSALPNLKHLKVSCPGQVQSECYRRSIVDYALISLRIAVERSNLPALDTMSLLSVHPGATLYLNPLTGFGVTPRSAKRWRQIRKLTIEMDTVHMRSPVDHLKLLHSYLQVFVSSITRFRFRWLGDKGPCPVSLNDEPCLQTSSPRHVCPKTRNLALRPIRFQRLRDMEVDNTILDASQIASFITSHRRTLRDFSFENTHLRNGTWDEALSPLTRISGNEKWKEKTEEVMDVPIMLSPMDLEKDQLNRIWNEHIRSRSSKPLQEALHRAGAKGKEILFGTEEHMRKLLRTSVFSWR